MSRPDIGWYRRRNRLWKQFAKLCVRTLVVYRRAIQTNDGVLVRYNKALETQRREIRELNYDVGHAQVCIESYDREIGELKRTIDGQADMANMEIARLGRVNADDTAAAVRLAHEVHDLKGQLAKLESAPMMMRISEEGVEVHRGDPKLPCRTHHFSTARGYNFRCEHGDCKNVNECDGKRAEMQLRVFVNDKELKQNTSVEMQEVSEQTCEMIGTIELPAPKHKQEPAYSVGVDPGIGESVSGWTVHKLPVGNVGKHWVNPSPWPPSEPDD